MQIRSAEFRGTLPDEIVGSGTELQVVGFQRGYLKQRQPAGIADIETMEAVENFSKAYPVDFNELKCPCGICDGFGQ